MKELKPKNEEDYHKIKERLEILKNHFAAYEILEEEEKFHVFTDNNKELSSEIDKLQSSKEFDIIKEGSLDGHGKPISKEELIKLFDMGKAMCKISFNNVNKRGTKRIGKGQKFFLKRTSIIFHLNMLYSRIIIY